MAKKGSALGVARARFVEGLPRKAKELKGAMALLVATPDAERPREEMRRRMHALYASAQVFRLEPLAAALKECIARLDASREEGRALHQDDLDALARLGAKLPGLAEGAGSGPSLGASPPKTIRGGARRRRVSELSDEPTDLSADDSPTRPGTLLGISPPQDELMASGQGDEQTGEPAIAESGDSLAPEAEPLSLTTQRKARSKRPGTMLGVGAVPAQSSQRSPAPAAGDNLSDLSADEGETSDPRPSPSGEVIARLQLQKRPSASGAANELETALGKPTATVASSHAASANAGTTPIDVPAPPGPSGSFTAARRGRSSHPPFADGDVLRTVLSVLVVDRAAAQARIRDVLPRARFEVVAAADPEEALRLARSVAPDVVLIDRAIAERDGVALIARLRNDPLTDLVPVALLHDGEPLDFADLRKTGADAQVGREGLEDTLEARLESLATASLGVPSAAAFGELTLEEVAARLADELRRGIVESAVEGRGVSVDLGEGSDLLAAAWATIAKVRAELAEKSGGQVRFRDGARGGPAFMSLVGQHAAPQSEDHESPSPDGDAVSLQGVRILVADDDPAVVWFFAGLFREEGAVVQEVSDGKEALDAARRIRPDLVVSDILMPRMDGLMLCRHLERDPALAEVPVILLSWKEDFIQRMRELKAGASGYLRKEAASAQILQRVREVLKPRVRLERQLAGVDEVRGRIEGVGVIPLLRAVGRLRKDARVTVRDAWNLFEVDIRDGELMEVTRTATDGSFARGRRALMQILGVTAGRFTTAEGSGPVRSSFPTGDPDDLLAGAAAELGALVDAVSGKRLAQVGSIVFDDDVARAFARTSPPEQRRVADALMHGHTPRDLLVSGDIEPQVVEETLLDLSRRGAVLDVKSHDGSNLVADALAARGSTSSAAWATTELGNALHTTAGRNRERGEHGERGEQGKHGELEELEAMPPGAVVRPSTLPLESDRPPPDPEREARALLEAPTNAPPLALGDAQRDSVVGVAAPDFQGDSASRNSSRSTDPSAYAKGGAPDTDVKRVLPLDSDVMELGALEPPPKPPRPPRSGSPNAQRALNRAGTDDSATAPTASSKGQPATTDASASKATAGATPSKATRVTGREQPSSPRLLELEQRPTATSSGGSLFLWMGLILICALLGYFGMKFFRAQQGTREPLLRPVASSVQEETASSPRPVEEDSLAEDPEPVEESMEAPSQVAGLAFGETLDGIATEGEVPVGEGEGLLVVRALEAGDDVRVILLEEQGERDLGVAPVSVALPEGRHRIVFRRGDREQFRYLYIGAGQSRIVDPDADI